MSPNLSRPVKRIMAFYNQHGAAKRHLEPLDYNKLQAAATKFMRNGFKVTGQ